MEDTGKIKTRVWKTEAGGQRAHRVSPSGDFPLLSPGAPSLSITLNPQLSTLNLSWLLPSTDWTLQQNTNSVSSVNWSNVTATIQDDGTTKTLIVNPPTGNRFCRLHKP